MDNFITLSATDVPYTLVRHIHLDRAEVFNAQYSKGFLPFQSTHLKILPLEFDKIYTIELYHSNGKIPVRLRLVPPHTILEFSDYLFENILDYDWHPLTNQPHWEARVINTKGNLMLQADHIACIEFSAFIGCAVLLKYKKRGIVYFYLLIAPNTETKN